MTAITKETESPSVPDRDLQRLSLSEKGTGGARPSHPWARKEGKRAARAGKHSCSACALAGTFSGNVKGRSQTRWFIKP